MSRPRVTVRGGIHVPRELHTEEEIRQDWTALSCPNPARVQAVRAQRPGAHRIPERISSLLVTDTDVVYPASVTDLVSARLELKRGTFAFSDARPKFEPDSLPFQGTPLPFQEKAVSALLRHMNGGLVAPCGAGKGEMLCMIVGRLGYPTLIVVASVDQAVELRERLAKRLGVTTGYIGGGELDVERITVALVQSLSPKVLADLADRFGVLIVDEGHHAAAESYRAVSIGVAARRRYWLTATPDREDGLTPFIEHHLGQVRHVVTREELVEAGRLVEPSFVELPTRFTFAYRDRDDWMPMLAALVADERRNAFIADQVAMRGAGAVSLVLTGRVEHAEVLRGLLEQRGLRAATLTGQTSKDERVRAIDDARAGALAAVCSTQLADEGLDIPTISRVFLTFPTKAEGRLVQRVGRALRVLEGKPEPVIYDVVDPLVGPLKHQAKLRREIFAKTYPSMAQLPGVAA